MANLSCAEITVIKSSLDAIAEPWILAAYDLKNSPTEDLIGVLDWRLHGILSQLVEKKSLPENQVAYIPSKTKLGVASLLLFSFRTSAKSSTALVDNLKSLHVESVCLFESTFPQDFLPNLKQTLSKAGIRWTMFEPKLTT